MASSISSNATKKQTLANLSKVRNSGSRSNSEGQTTVHPQLHPKESIGIAAFLGSPIAGGVLLAHNLVKTSRIAQAVMVMLGTIAATGIMIAIGMAMPEAIRLGVVLPLAAAMGLKKIAENLFTNEYRMVEDGKSEAHSKWIGVCFGFLFAGLIFSTIWLSL